MVASAVRVWATRRNGIQVGGEEELADRFRSRAKLPRGARPGRRLMRHRWAGACTDLTVYAEQSLGKDAVMAMDPEEYCEGIHEVFVIVAGKTRLVADYVDVLEEEASWRLITRGLLRLRAGERFTMQPVTVDTGAGVGKLEGG